MGPHRQMRGRGRYSLGMDGIDREILAILAAHGRASFSAIGRQVGLSTNAAAALGSARRAPRSAPSCTSSTPIAPSGIATASPATIPPASAAAVPMAASVRRHLGRH